MKTVVLLVIISLLTACERKPQAVVLGPMPSETVMPDPVARQTAGELRQWVQNFRSGDARKLNESGKILLSWEELQAAYPGQAHLVDDYVEQLRTNLVQVFERQSKPIPDRLATRRNPDAVEVERLGIGKYRVVISSKAGIEHAFLEISETQ